MKKNILNIIIIIILSIVMIGCIENNQSKKETVNISFVYNNKVFDKELKKGIIIGKYIVDIFDEEDIEGLYYDDQFLIEYDYKEINKDINIYIKMKKAMVTFEYLNKEEIIQIDIHSILDKNKLSNLINKEVIDLYYDKRFTKKYDNEEITENVTMYVDIKLDYATQLGTFYTIQEMVDMNIFSYMDVYTIDFIHNIKEYNSHIIDIESLDLQINKSLGRQIAYDFKCYLNCDCESHDYNENIEYLGTYKGCIVVKIKGCQEYEEYKIGNYKKEVIDFTKFKEYNVHFTYKTSQPILVWQPNE